MNVSFRFILGMRNVSDIICREKMRNVSDKITHILRSVIFFPPENHAVYEVILKDIVQSAQAADDSMAHCMLDT